MAVAAHETFESEQYIFVDQIEELRLARLDERIAAEDLLEERRETYEATGVLPYEPVDALSTAYSVLDARWQYGEDSWQFEEKWEGLLLDCQRLIGEWYRKKRPEYFAPTRHIYNETEEEFFSHGLSIRQMTENALTPIADNPEEEARRVNERVEDATPQFIRGLGGIAIGDVAIRTISECTDKAVEDYTHDLGQGNKHRGYNGYVPEIEKIMIRDIRLDPFSKDRFEEQIGIPGTYITHEVVQTALARKGVEAAHMGKTELHGSQVLVKDDVLAFARLLDETAKEKWNLINKDIFMGEIVELDHPKDYAKFKQEALARQEELKDWAETIALFVLDLAEDDFDRKKAPSHVEEFVKAILLDMARKDNVVAEEIFDKDTAERLVRVNELESRGLYDAARLLLEETRQEAPGGGFCGAGSCGLEGVTSNKEDQALRKKMGAEDGDILLKDKERACRCGKKSIVYALNKKGFIKFCEGCGASEKKTSKA